MAATTASSKTLDLVGPAIWWDPETITHSHISIGQLGEGLGKTTPASVAPQRQREENWQRLSVV